jgi:hypothetical protein
MERQFAQNEEQWAARENDLARKKGDDEQAQVQRRER